MRILALQSGTSADGIDAAVVDIDASGDALELVVDGWGTEPWRPEERELVMRAVAGDPLDAGEWCAVETTVGQAFARAATRFAAGAGVDLVCSHGQTVFHGVEGAAVWGTLQVGEPAWIARATGCPVVFNLRVADVAAGGMGAPLITAFDARWLAGAADAAGAPVASLNLGGIANLQVVRPDGTASGFDTGPANALLDACVSRATAGAETFDRDGAYAAAGRVDSRLLDRLRAHPYFALAAPKTTGRETFTLGTVDDALDGAGLPLEDVCATLVELTASTVADALTRTAPTTARVVVSGGGARNPVLLARLRELLGIPVEPSDAWGIPADAREAVMFAALAYLSAARVPLDLPGTPDGRAAVAGQWDLSVAPLPAPPTVTAASPQLRRLRVRTREERS
ncbi:MULTISPECIES: anhydro-N-acetylmuramic acid kinase [Microbacterium]|uniref:anhydro-N-acetylmuramic acid kinase n=1 Tax=Microbacterium TaxID=33882 RepID=UPI000D65BE38|nr:MULTISPECIES: anhydro-N-acetylmuramic acid kinase [Microbacterium]